MAEEDLESNSEQLEEGSTSGSADKSKQIMPLLCVGCFASGIITAPYICSLSSIPEI